MKGILSYLCALGLTLVVFSGTAFAQSFPTDKGSMILMGGFAFSSAGGDLYENRDGDRFMSIQFDPSLSYFVTPGLALGGQFSLERDSQGDYTATTWGIGPRLAYFVGGNQPRASAKGTTLPYVGVSFLYLNSSVDWNGDDSASGTMIGFGIGFLNMLTNTVGFFGEAGYQIDNMEPEDGDSESGNQITAGLGITAFIY